MVDFVSLTSAALVNPQVHAKAENIASDSNKIGSEIYHIPEKILKKIDENISKGIFDISKMEHGEERKELIEVVRKRQMELDKKASQLECMGNSTSEPVENGLDHPVLKKPRAFDKPDFIHTRNSMPKQF